MGRGKWPVLSILGLHVVTDYLRLHRKPLVTAFLILINALIFIRPPILSNLFPTVDEVGFSPHLIIQNKDAKRFFLSDFYHVGEVHLFHNMIALLCLGKHFELSMGSVKFTAMVFELIIYSKVISLLVAKALLSLFNYGNAYYGDFSVGFSGIIFAMDLVRDSSSEGNIEVHGLTVPIRYSAWVHLILVQLFVPNVSFLGHLNGILAGLLYLWLRRSISSPGFISTFIDNLLPPERAHGEYLDEGVAESGVIWRCGTCTSDNSGLLDACEMCGGMRDQVRINLSSEELRQRRVERFAVG